MVQLSETTYGQEWLTNFPIIDQEAAKLLMNKLLLIGSSDFSLAINTLLKANYIDSCSEKISLYAEREVDDCNNEIPPFFPDSEKGKASGEGIQPVEVDIEKQDVGSEGILAALITKFCKSYSNSAFSHLGPDNLRENKIRKIVIVTDFIGSGKRVHDMLTAFSKVASLQSWKSYHFLTFEVICFSATEYGLSTVSRHPLKPSVHYHMACPTIDEIFSGKELGAVNMLCKKYPPNSQSPFGFRNTGSLIVFAHGIPNNAPDILHDSANGWKPIFKGRSTIIANIDAIADSKVNIEKTSNETLKIRNAQRLLNDRDSELWLHTMLILKNIQKGHKKIERLSGKTHLPNSTVEEILKLSKEAKWITPKNTLTALGRRELKWIRWSSLFKNMVAKGQNELYFPNELRA